MPSEFSVGRFLVQHCHGQFAAWNIILLRIKIHYDPVSLTRERALKKNKIDCRALATHSGATPPRPCVGGVGHSTPNTRRRAPRCAPRPQEKIRRDQAYALIKKHEKEKEGLRKRGSTGFLPTGEPPSSRYTLDHCRGTARASMDKPY